MNSTGETPGAGTYYCTNCGQDVTIENDADELPICPKCGNTEFEKG